jgi:general secretion pathway protein H
MDTTKTSPATIFSKSVGSPKGFTLLELLIVLFILGTLIGFGIPKMNFRHDNIKTVTRQMSVMTREIRNYARMKQMTCRLVIRMDGDNSKEKDAYWVEGATGSILAPTSDTKKKLEEMSDEDRPKNPFQKIPSFTKKEKLLPDKVYFGSVETQSQSEPITKGLAYVYFTPEGLVEKATIQLTDKDKLTWTLVINPLTGHTDIVEKAISLKDLQND